MPETTPPALLAHSAPRRRRPSVYPEPFASRMAGRDKQPLGALFELQDFGVNLTRLAPGSVTALRHAHSTQDEFIYVLEGEAVLITDRGETALRPGMCAGFRAGNGDAHHVHNRSERDVVLLEVGSRSAGDTVVYPDDDIAARLGDDGAWVFTRKDGTPY